MKKQELYSLIADELNLEDGSLNETSVLFDIQGWDSMSILVIMTIVDENFGITLSADDFTTIDTIKDLEEKIGAENFK